MASVGDAWMLNARKDSLGMKLSFQLFLKSKAIRRSLQLKALLPPFQGPAVPQARGADRQGPANRLADGRFRSLAQKQGPNPLTRVGQAKRLAVRTQPQARRLKRQALLNIAPPVRGACLH